MTTKPFHLAVRAVIRDPQGQCLLLRRSNACRSFKGTWEWPGGKADAGESLEETVRREVVEETGLEIELTGVAGAFHIDMQDLHIAVLCLEATLSGGSLCLSEEHDRSAWVPLSDLRQWDLTEGLKQFAAVYVQRVTANC